MLWVLELGVIDFVIKLQFGICEGMLVYSEMIVEKVCIVVWVCIVVYKLMVVLVILKVGLLFSLEKLIVIGVLMGGIEVI